MIKENKPLNINNDDVEIYHKDKIPYLSPLVKCFLTKSSVLGNSSVVGSDSCFVSTHTCS